MTVFKTKPRPWRQQCSPKKQSTDILQPPLRFSSSLHVSPNKGIKMKTQQKNIKKWRKTYRSMAWCFANVLMSPRNSPKWLVKSSDLIKPPEEFFQKTPPANSTLPTPGGHRNASHWILSEAVECRGAFRTEEPLTLRSWPPQPPKTYIPPARSLHTDVW